VCSILQEMTDNNYIQYEYMQTTDTAENSFNIMKTKAVSVFSDSNIDDENKYVSSNRYFYF
jgi:hypothetical protein